MRNAMKLLSKAALLASCLTAASAMAQDASMPPPRDDSSMGKDASLPPGEPEGTAMKSITRTPALNEDSVPRVGGSNGSPAGDIGGELPGNRMGGNDGPPPGGGGVPRIDGSDDK